MALFFGNTSKIEQMIEDTNVRVRLVDKTLLEALALLKDVRTIAGGIMAKQEKFNAQVGELDVTLDVIRAGVQGLQQHAANLEAVVADLRNNDVDTSALEAVVAEARQLADGFRPVVTDEPTPTDPGTFPVVEPVEGADPVDELPVPEPAPATGDTGAADDEAGEVPPAPADTGTVEEAPAPVDESTETAGEGAATEDGTVTDGTEAADETTTDGNA